MKVEMDTDKGLPWTTLERLQAVQKAMDRRVYRGQPPFSEEEFRAKLAVALKPKTFGDLSLDD